MFPWTLWLSVIVLVGFGAAADVPFVFDENVSSVANYTSAQLEQAHISSTELMGVPPVTSAADNATLPFPVVGGGSNPQGITEKKVAELRKMFDLRVEPENPTVHDTAVDITVAYPGESTVDQVSAIFSYLITGDNQKKGWSYVAGPRGINDFFYANETLKRGEKATRVGVGDCGDFAILMSALVESIGGTTRIILASNNTTGGHAYAQVYIGQDNIQNSQTEKIIKYLEQVFNTDKIFTNIDTNTRDVWLNLDWWPDQNGSPHPGGPFFPGDKNLVLFIREIYPKVPLKLPESPIRPTAVDAQVTTKLPQFKSGASVIIGIPVDSKILNQRVGSIYDLVESDDSHIVWKFTGTTSDWAFVFADGRVIVASTVELDLAAKDTLEKELNAILDILNKVGGGVSGEPRTRAMESATYYAQDAAVYHRIKYDFANNFNLRLTVPDCRVEKARLIVTGRESDLYVAMAQYYYIDGNQVAGCNDQNCVTPVTDIKDKIPYGVHSISAGSIDAPHTMFIEAITSPAPKNFVLYSDDYSTWINETTRSLTLKDMYMLIMHPTSNRL